MSARGTPPSRGGTLGRHRASASSLGDKSAQSTCDRPEWGTAEHRGGPQAQSPPGSGPGIQARGLPSPGGGRLRKEGATESVSTFTLTGLAGAGLPQGRATGHWGRSKKHPRHPGRQRQRATQAKAKRTRSAQATGGTTLFTSTARTCPPLLDTAPSPPPAAGGAPAPCSGPGPFGPDVRCATTRWPHPPLLTLTITWGHYRDWGQPRKPRGAGGHCCPALRPPLLRGHGPLRRYV